MKTRQTSLKSIRHDTHKLILFVLLAAILLDACHTSHAQQQQQQRPFARRAAWRVSSREDYAPRAGATSSGLARPASLCNREEKTLFSCALKGSRKLLSICGSGRLDANSGYLQYRFGRAGDVEFEFPKEKKGTQAAFRYTRYTRPLVTYLVLRFETQGYLYSVHQNYNGEERPAVNEARVTVAPLKQKRAQATEFQCRLPVEGTLMNLEDVVRRADDEEPLEP